MPVYGLIAVLAICGSEVGCGGGQDRPEAAAKIGATRIELSTIAHQERLLRDFRRQNPGTALKLSRQDLLGTLIQTEWMRQEAASFGVEISPRRVGDEAGKDLIYRTVASHFERGRKFPVRSSEVRSYYISHRTEFAQPARRYVNIVETASRAKAVRAADALRKGRTWRSTRAIYGRRVPRVPEASRGLPIVVKGQLPDPLGRNVFAAARNDLRGPIAADSSWFVFTVLGSSPAGMPSFKDAYPSIAAQLQTEKRAAYIDRSVSSLSKKYRPRTICARELAGPKCKNAPQTSS
jgi:hypothetical protein